MLGWAPVSVNNQPPKEPTQPGRPSVEGTISTTASQTVVPAPISVLNGLRRAGEHSAHAASSIWQSLPSSMLTDSANYANAFSSYAHKTRLASVTKIVA